ncbi:MAG: tetratricopeptide repeat protein [Bacteroidia bacterium]|nr:tetratricopeptide repeat protein [Bacteroidia bacterium]
MKKLLFYFLLLLISNPLFSQENNPADSLLKILNTTKNDTVKANILIDLFKETVYSNPEKARKFAKDGLEISQNADYKKGIAKFLRYHGILFQRQGSYNKAIDYTKEALAVYEKLSDKSGIADCWIDMGTAYWYQSNYIQSIECMQKSMKIKEEIGDKNGISICLINIGNIYGDQKNYLQALNYYQKSRIIFEELDDKKGVSDCMNNIGVIYMDHLKNNDSALYYIQRSLNIREELSDRNGIAECIMSLGIIYSNKKNNIKALKCYQQCLTLFEELGDKAKISVLYSNIGTLFYNQGKAKEAIEAYNKGLVLSKETGSIYTILVLYKGLSAAYAKICNFNAFRECDSLCTVFSDSIFSYENSKKVSEISAKYETEKKELQINLQATELNKQKTVRNYLFGVMALVLLLVVVMIIAYRTKQKANRQLQILNVEITGQKMEIEFKNDALTRQKYEISEKNEELSQQNDEIRAQRDEIEHQKKIIEERSKEVMDSIHYAKRIQSAILPDKEIVDSYLSDYFILFRPKDIVSGDFYWIVKRKNYILLAAADCTGHGVPGAFMSMLGFSFLNEIIAKDEVTMSSHVLDQLREYVIHSLQQKGVMGEQKDGMDMSFCAWDINTNILQYAGANNPLYIIKKLQLTEKLQDAVAVGSEMPQLPTTNYQLPTAAADCQLLEVKPDKMPIAIYEKMSPFTNNVLHLEKGDSFYIFSDGYSDQLGGPNTKKMLKKRFKELLLEIQHLGMNEQRDFLFNTFEQWRGAHEQVDDVLVIGIRV